MQEGPPPAPPQGPSIDIGSLAHAIGEAVGQAFQTVLGGWANGLPDQVSAETDTHVRHLADQFAASGLNFVFHTPMDLITIGMNTIAPADVRTFTSDAATLAIALAGLSYVGHYLFGGPSLGQNLTRVCVAIILTGSALRIVDLGVNGANALMSAIVPGNLSMPSASTGFLPFDVVATGVWIILLLRLEIIMGKRMIWLGALSPVLLVSTPGFMHPKSAWIPSMFWKAWWGWLLGQALVVISTGVSMAMAQRVGGPGGYVLSLAALLVAYDAVKMLVPRDSNGGISLSYGAGPASIQL